MLGAAERRAAALAAADADALRALHHPRFTATTHRGEVLALDAYVAANTGPGGLAWRSQRLEAPEVVAVGACAVLRAVVIDEVERCGQVERFRLRLTQTWVREDGRWRLLAQHAGPPAG